MWIIHKVINGKERLEYYEDIIYDFAWEEFELVITFRLFTEFPKYRVWLEYRCDKTARE